MLPTRAPQLAVSIQLISLASREKRKKGPEAPPYLVSIQLISLASREIYSLDSGSQCG